MSCYQIFHSDIAKGMWKIERGKTRVQKSHRVYKMLSEYWMNQPFVDGGVNQILSEDSGSKSGDEERNECYCEV